MRTFLIALLLSACGGSVPLREVTYRTIQNCDVIVTYYGVVIRGNTLFPYTTPICAEEMP